MKQQVLKVTAVAILSSSVLLFSACSKKPTMASAANASLAAQANYQTASAKDGAAKTYAAPQTIAYKKDPNGFMINPTIAPANQTYYFSFARSELRANDMKALMAQADFLATHPKAKVRLEGNTDNRGSREYNIGLGWRRDQTVARILEQQGVKPSQIQMVSYGKQNPVAQGNNERSWALNRRVVMVYK